VEQFDEKVKMCVDCGRTKAFTEFCPKRNAKDGLLCYCRECANRRRTQSRERNKDRHREVQREWRRRNVEKRQIYDLRQIAQRYGIDKVEYFALVASQNGVCAICAKRETISGRRLSVDHDHMLGGVRGLLCSNCNLGVGYFYDDPGLLHKAAEYIEQWRSNSSVSASA